MTHTKKLALYLFLCLMVLSVGCSYNPTAYRCKECGSTYVITGAWLPGHGARRHCASCGGYNTLRVYEELSPEKWEQTKRQGYYTH